MSSNDKTKLNKQVAKVVDFCNYYNYKIDKIFKECFSGRDSYDYENELRVELGNLMKKLKKDDLIFCQSISRLSRKGRKFVKFVIDYIHNKGANVYFIAEKIYSSEENIHEILLLADKAKEHNYMLAELQKERYRLNEKQKQMIRGKKKDFEVVKVAIDDYIGGCGNRTKKAICNEYHLSRPTFDKYLKLYQEERNDDK